MTLSPVSRTQFVRGIDGETYKVGPHCAAPGCGRFADHAHHIFRRSMLGGPFSWVEVDKQVFGNLTGLCAACHDKVTGNVGGHSAAIRLEHEHDPSCDLDQDCSCTPRSVFIWCNVETFTDHVLRYHPVGLLDPQPPTPDSASARVLGHETESEHCPLCGQTKRRRRTASTPEPRRRRKTWTVSVPDDSEDGADILDTFVDEIALLLGAGDWEERNRRYWALVHALAWTMQQRERFAQDAKAVA